jgi:hypothetical protein
MIVLFVFSDDLGSVRNVQSRLIVPEIQEEPKFFKTRVQARIAFDDFLIEGAMPSAMIR